MAEGSSESDDLKRHEKLELGRSGSQDDESTEIKKASTTTPKQDDRVSEAHQTQTKGGRKQKKGSSSKPKEKKQSLQAAMKKGRKKNGQGSQDVPVPVPGFTEEATASKHKGTGLVYDDTLKGHSCPHGSEHGKSESPERLSACYERLQEQGLLDRCVPVTTRSATDEEILSIHSKEYLEAMKSSSSLPPPELRQLAESFDSIFLCPESFELANKTAGGVLNLVEQVVQGKLSNGFAVVRPPGHHAQRDVANGYSLLNNVAIAAKIARTKWNVERVLIVDWDVHHGQGVQFAFEDDPSVLYFSVHRYENMAYWPHLKESNYDHIGKGLGKGYNINIPWNQVGMGDVEYLAAFQQVLLPVAYEFQPELILVCAGFDAVAGDPKGEMNVSASCFSHLTHQLMGLAGGKVVLCLEGGYSLQDLAAAVASCTETLLGDPCPPLPPLKDMCKSSVMTLTSVTEAINPYWKCLQCYVTPSDGEQQSQEGDVASATHDALGSEGGGEGAVSDASVTALGNRLMREVTLSKPPHRTGLVYDERMKLHRTYNHPERPERIARIFSKHQERGLVNRCLQLQARQATEEELASCHKCDFIQDLKQTGSSSARELIGVQDKFSTTKYNRDVYIHPDTYLCAAIAAGCCLNLVDAVCTNQVMNAVGIVRPPGHHADGKTASGFCFFNNVALAARYAQTKYGINKILIVDWDVHHGNGTQAILEDDPSIMYISLHRHDEGLFYPPGPFGGADRVGRGDGRGYNVNIAWNTDCRGGVGDAEYIAAFHRIVMPIASQFSPELVFISAGFDAAAGDPLGGCNVSPEGYGHMTHMLSSLAGGRLITVLEGGYNLHSIAVSMAMCTQVMLGDTCPALSLSKPSCVGLQAIYDTAKAHQDLWSSMKLQVKLMETWVIEENVTEGGNWVDSPVQVAAHNKEEGTDSKENINKEGSELEGREGDLSSADKHDETSRASTVKRESQDGASSVAEDGKEPERDVSGASRIEPQDQISSDLIDRKEAQGEISGDSQDRPETQDDDVTNVADAIAQMSIKPSEGGNAYIKKQSDDNDDEALGACGLAEPECVGGAHASPKVSDVLGHVISAFGSQVEMHAVVPLPWCPHLRTHVGPLPSKGLDCQMPCLTCDDHAENWVCLQCFQVYCGRYVKEHMLMHGLESGHLLVLSYADLSAWCYGCDAYIHHEVLMPAKKAAHRSKFGVDPGM